MNNMQILLLGHEGSGRRGLERTLTRLGYVVMSADPGAMAAPPSSGDMIMVDMREDSAPHDHLADALRGDGRPLVAVSDAPTDAVRRLIGRPAGTMVLTGAESDAGYKVALSVCQALLRGASARQAQTAPDSRVVVA